MKIKPKIRFSAVMMCHTYMNIVWVSIAIALAWSTGDSGLPVPCVREGKQYRQKAGSQK